MGPVSPHLKRNHGLRCAKRLGVRWQQPPLFAQFTAIVHPHYHSEKAVLKPASALAHFPYGARAESVCWCAGINRQEAEDEKSLRGRNSDPLGPEFCAVRHEARSEA